ncbi:uncharacterized protein LOC103706985 isoform X2 [Phoenix dactylifera]|uniref:Uncharacterized protein LOC103706985 isoform X2 n=1 Tax=Phoenix dactylifera TaxID=42345 RepID=A0A8B7C1C7_PHODC|nr:uncharacterized protein LOC103706985 isoform X2 [Phoenix dactylifera]
MIGKRVLLTYKRKRFSSQPHHGKGITADSTSKSPTGILLEISSQEAESGADNEKLNKDNTHCSRCGSVDVNENLLGCVRCLRNYHLRCISPLSKEKWQCSACIKSHEFEESMQQQVQETNENKKNKSIEESEIGPIELHSHKMVLSTRPFGDSSAKTSSSANDASFNKIKNIVRTDESYTDSGSACKVPCTEGSSSSKVTDLEIVGRSNPICLDSLTERKSNSGFPEDCVSVLLISDKRESFLCNEQRPKDNCSTPLITFSRRVRKKRDVGEKFMGGNLRAEEIQCSTCTWSKIGPSCRCEGSIPECNFMDHSTKAVLPEQADCRPLHVVQQAMMADVGKDAGVESGHADALATKNAGDTGDKLSLQCSHILEKPNVSHQYPLPSQPARHVPEDPSEKLAAAHTTDVIRDSILVHGCRVSSSLGNKLVGTTNSSEKAITLHGVSKDRSHLSDLEFSIAPPTSNSLTKIESSKSTSSVLPENLLESQSSLARSYGIIMADKETDGKVDELKWLETLDKELQDTKKQRSICSSLEQSVINCEQASNGRASSMFPIGSSVKSRHDQDASREFENQITGSHGRAYLTKSVETGFEKQRHEETTNKSSFSTGFLGLWNSEGPDVSVKDFQSMHSSLNFSIKDSVHEYNRRFPWPSVGVNASVSKQKQIVDNIITGSQMLEKRQAPLLDKFKRNANEWSEEELDFLWIGVRRYGVNNWNAMLRDPKLCFMKSRGAEDIAERWNLEQRKLLNGALLQPGRLSVRDLSLPPFMNDSWLAKPSSSNHNGGNGAWSGCSEFPMLAAEPQLSLGDAYLKNENTSRRNPLYSLGLGSANPLTSVSPPADSIQCSFPVGSSYLGSGLDNHKSFNVHNTRYDYESSSSHQKPVERLTQDRQLTSLPASNLPHWLRDVLIPQAKPSNSTLPPPVSALAQSTSMLGNDTRVEPTAPPKDSRGRGILKRKNVTSGNHASIAMVSERSVSTSKHRMGKRPGAFPTLVGNSQTPTSVNTGSSLNGVSSLNKNSGPVGPSNLVVIDSDASSEETISDS